MDKTILVTCIKDPLNPYESREIKEFTGTLPIRQAVREFFPAPGDATLEVVVSLTSPSRDLPLRTLTAEEIDTFIAVPGDSIVFCAAPMGGGGGNKDIGRVLAMIAIVIVAAITQQWYLTAYGVPAASGVGYTAGSMAMSGAIGASVAVAGGFLVNSFLPLPKTQDLTGTSTSPTYSWDPLPNSESEGQVVPVLYGRHRVKPPKIGRYVSLYDGIKHGEISGVELHSAGSGYTSVGWLRGVELTVVQSGGSKGTVWAQIANGAIIAVSPSARGSGYSVGTNLQLTGGGGSGGSINITAVDQSAGDASKQNLQLLFAVADHYVDTIELVEINQNPITYYPDVVTEIRAGTTDQTVIPFFGDTPADVPVGAKLSTSWTTRRISGTTQGIGVGLYLSGLFYAEDDNSLSARTVTPTVQYKKASESDSAYVTMTTAAITEGTSDVVRRFWHVDVVEDQYDIRVKVAEEESTDPRERNTCYWEFYETCLYDDFTYPGTALLGLKALATDKLSGGEPEITCVAERTYVAVWDGSTWVAKPANNPAWACYDSVLNSDYGGGRDKSRMIYSQFSSWADWCASKGYTCNVYFDTIQTLRNATNIISALGRGMVIQQGIKFGCLYDSDVLPTQRFLFGMGNIEQDSFSEEWFDLDERANVVEVSYYDADLNWTKQTVTLEQEGYDSLDDKSPASIDFIGCTDRTMAIKYGKYRLNKNRYITNQSSWAADYDAIGCLPGDVVEVAHDVPQWGYSGRIVSATAGGVVLDQDITMEPGTTYWVKIQHLATDVVELRQVTAVGLETTTDTLTLTSNWTNIPVQFANFHFGPTNRVDKLFRLAKTTRASSQRRTLVGIEHVVEVYDDSATVPTPEIISDLPTVTGLTAVETFRYSPNGAGTPVISLSWRGAAVSWKIYKNTVIIPWPVWTLIGETSNPFFEIVNYPPGTYQFAVSPTNNGDDGDDCWITTTGLPYVPETPVGVNVAFSNQTVLLSWTASDNIAVAGYNIYLEGVLLQGKYTSNQYVYTGLLTPGTYDFTVTAVDAYGQESAPSAVATLTVAAPDPSTGLLVNFAGRDCYFSWDQATALSFAYYSLSINGNEKIITNSAISNYRYSFDENIKDNTTPTASLPYVLKIVDIFGNVSTTVTGTATNTAPSTPSGVVTTFTGRDCIFSWTADASGDFSGYALTINSTTYTITTPFYTYSFDQNVKDNTTADPSLSYSLVAVDAFGQSSTVPATGTATNAAPSAPTNLTVAALFQSVMIRFDGVSGSDIEAYEVYISTTNGFTPGPGTLYTTGPQTEITYTGASATDYYVRVRAKDAFGQFSSYTAQGTATTDFVADVTLYRTDFLVKNSIFYFDATTLHWSSGSIVLADTEYTLTAGTRSNANSKYVVATLSGATATISIVALGVMPTLNDNQVIIAYTSATTTDDGDYICYVRQANSMLVEGADIRDATIYNAKIANLAVTNAKILSLDVGKLTAGTITSQGIILSVTDGVGDVYIRGGSKTDFVTTNAGFIIGLDDSDSNKAKMYLGDATNYMYWDGTNFCATGTVNTKTGYIGGTSGWVVSSENIKDASGVVGMSATVTIGDDIRIWAGNATPSSAPFRVTESGALVATSATITGDITASTGYFQAVTLGKTGVASGTITLQLWDGHGDTYLAAGKTDFLTTGSGFILGLDDSDSNKAKFYLGDATSYLYWDGTDLILSGAVWAGGTTLSGTIADTFTVNSDLTDANVQLILGRTTGGNATFQWNGTAVSLNKTLSIDTLAEYTTAHGVIVSGITHKGGTNTFSLANGTASIDIAAGATLDVNNNLTVSGIADINQNVTTTAGPTFDHIHTNQVYVDHIAEKTSSHTVVFDNTIGVDNINEVTSAHGVILDGVTLKDGGGLIVTGGSNTFSLTNGTASLDVATGAIADINYGLTVSGISTINQDVSTTAGPSWDHIHVNSIQAPANLSIAPSGDVIFDPTGNDVLPNTNYDINMGAINKKYLTLFAAELWVETLVAQNTIATIGGRILVGPTNTLTSDLAAAATTIYVKYNNFVNGDRVYMEANGWVEFMAITSSASGVGPYSYTVTRNLDGTGANDWYAGDALFDTGQTGNGFIDIYSIRGVKAASQYGPTIVGNVRNSATYNDWTECWAIGNLNGIYGYGLNTYGAAFGKYSAANYLTVDATNGIRFLDSSNNVQAQLSSTAWTLGQVAASKSNVYISAGLLQLRNNTTARIQLATDGSGFLANSSISWDASGNLTIGGSAYIAGATNGWQISAGKITALGTGLIETSSSASTGIKIDSTSFRGYNGSVQTAEIKTDGSGWFGLTGTKSISWTTAGVVTIGGYTATASALYAGTGATRVQMDTTTGIWLGATAFASAPFSVSLAGAVTATNATVYGTIKTSSTVGSTKGIELSGTNNEAYFYGDRGNGTIENLCSIGINTYGADHTILKIGSANSVGLYGIVCTVKDRSSIFASSDSSYGLWAQSASNYGIYVVSTSSNAIYALSTGAAGVPAITGTTTSGHGVYGNSTTGYGLYGNSGSGRGVYGYSGSGPGVYAEGNSGVALYVKGYTTTTANVGIGVAADTGIPLNVYGTPGTDGANVLSAQFINNNTAYNASPTAGIGFGMKYTSGGALAGMGGIVCGKENTTSGDLDCYLAFNTRAGSGANTERMRITSDGYVGIGKTPGYLLELNSDSAGKPGAGGLWTVASDERIKTDIELADLDRCYEIVKSIPLKYFGWADGVYTEDQVQDRHSLGWTAQDVQKVFPKAVSQKAFVKKIPDGTEEYAEDVFDAGLDRATVVTKTRDTFKEEVIEDCLDLNSGQLIAALYGTVQKLQQQVEKLMSK